MCVHKNVNLNVVAHCMQFLCTLFLCDFILNRLRYVGAQ